MKEWKLWILRIFIIVCVLLVICAFGVMMTEVYERNVAELATYNVTPVECGGSIESCIKCASTCCRADMEFVVTAPGFISNCVCTDGNKTIQLW